MEQTFVETALARLQALAEENPRMAWAVQYYRFLIPALASAGSCLPELHIPPEILQKKLGAGQPVLVGEELDIHPEDSRVIFLSVSQATGAAIRSAIDPTRPPDDRLQSLQKITSHVANGSLDLVALLSTADYKRATLVSGLSNQYGLDDDLLVLLARNSLKVYLHAWREDLERQVNLDGWRRSSCPFCGSAPALAEIQGVERSRYLRCLQCGSRWPYPILKCAFCGNDDHRSLGIMQIEDEAQKYYAHTCELCQRYIKTVITFDPIPAEILLVEDLATLHLDNLLKEKGYR